MPLPPSTVCQFRLPDRSALDGTEGYNRRYFASGKYVRTDGKAVLYIESSDSVDFFSFQLYAMADGGKDAWARPNEWDRGDYLSAENESSTRANNNMEFFTDNGDHSILVHTEYEDTMSLFYAMPDGVYHLVREK